MCQPAFEFRRFRSIVSSVYASIVLRLFTAASRPTVQVTFIHTPFITSISPIICMGQNFKIGRAAGREGLSSLVTTPKVCRAVVQSLKQHLLPDLSWTSLQAARRDPALDSFRLSLASLYRAPRCPILRARRPGASREQDFRLS